MRVYKKFISFGILLGACVYSTSISAQQGSKEKKPKLYDTLNITALAVSNGVTNRDVIKEQFQFLNNGLPKTLKLKSDSVLLKEKILDKADDSHKAEALRRLCFPEVKPVNNRPKGLFGTVAAVLAPKLIGLFVDEVDKGLEKEIAKYSETHKKEISIRPYMEDGTFQVRSSCFRYSSFTEKQYKHQIAEDTYNITSNRELDFDLIGQWRVLEGQYIRIRPLRLYMNTPRVPSDSKKVAVAVSAKASAVWRNENEGKKGEIFNTIILTEKLVNPQKRENSDTWTDGLKFYNILEDKINYYELDSEGKEIKPLKQNLNIPVSWTDFEALPILPYTEDFGSEKAIASLEVSVAEVGSGARKKVLKLAHKSLGLFKDDITSVLEEAASELLEDEAPVVDTPDKYCATFTSIISEEGILEGSAEWTGGNETCDDG